MFELEGSLGVIFNSAAVDERGREAHDPILAIDCIDNQAIKRYDIWVSRDP